MIKLFPLLIWDFGFLDIAIFVVEFPALQPTETRNAETSKYLAASSSTPISCFMTLRIPEKGTPIPFLLKCWNVQSRCVQQRLASNRTFRRFGVSDFANPDARLTTLLPPKPQNGQWVLKLPGNEYMPPVSSTILGLWCGFLPPITLPLSGLEPTFVTLPPRNLEFWNDSFYGING
jgi:hypothetical protein